MRTPTGEMRETRMRINGYSRAAGDGNNARIRLSSSALCPWPSRRLRPRYSPRLESPAPSMRGPATGANAPEARIGHAVLPRLCDPRKNLPTRPKDWAPRVTNASGSNAHRQGSQRDPSTGAPRATPSRSGHAAPGHAGGAARRSARHLDPAGGTIAPAAAEGIPRRARVECRGKAPTVLTDLLGID